LVATVPASADLLSITGSVSVSNNNIQFYPLGGTSGTFQIGPPDTGIFSPLIGTSGVSLDLNSVSEPVGTTVSVPDFMTFAGAPNLSFTLTELVPGTFTSCPGLPAVAGQTCTPPGTEYNLTNQTAMSSVASFTVDGYLVNTATPGVLTPFVGIFSTQFPNESYQEVVAQILNGGTAAATYSADFITSPSSSTPEPGTIFTLLSGGLFLLAIGTFGKRFRSTKRV
jgi:hypothetical protein